MKRIEFIAPVEAMRGKLSGEQTLVYAENNNPAYEAPNGVQYARNYQPRFIGAKIAKSGLKYFTVKTKSATKLDAQSRLTMGTLAGVAAIRSALMKDHASDYAQIIANLTADVVQGIISGTGKRTVMSLFYEKVAAMLQAKDDRVTFAGSTPVVVANPWYSVQPVGTIFLEINQVVWVKYAPLFWSDDNVTGGVHIRINGELLFVPWSNVSQTELPVWSSYKRSGVFTALNYIEMVSRLTYEAESENPLWSGSSIYLGSTLQEGTDGIEANAKYTA